LAQRKKGKFKEQFDEVIGKINEVVNILFETIPIMADIAMENRDRYGTRENNLPSFS
jgi:hypothetical protein